MNNLFSYFMQSQERIYTYGPEHKGTVINLSGVTVVELRMEAGGAGYDYSPKNTVLLGFRPKLGEKITIFPGRGGHPSKDGERTYLVRSNGSIETVYCLPGSGTPGYGDDGTIEVKLWGELDGEENAN